MARRLAIFCDLFPELSETFVSGEVRELRRQGVEVTVYARPPDHPDPHWNGVAPVRPLRSPLNRSVRRLQPLGTLAVTHPGAVIDDIKAQKRWGMEEDVAPLRRLAPAARALRHDGV